MVSEMVLGVIGFNVAIATIFFVGVWQLLQIRKAIAQWVTQLNTLEQELHQTLRQIPHTLATNQQQLKRQRHQYGQIHARTLQYMRWGRQSVAIIQWGQTWWRGSGTLSRSSLSPKE